jgi:hypothetical protein
MYSRRFLILKQLYSQTFKYIDMNKQLIQLGCLVALAFPMATKAQENVDLAMMQKIRQEG